MVPQLHSAARQSTYWEWPRNVRRTNAVHSLYFLINNTLEAKAGSRMRERKGAGRGGEREERRKRDSGSIISFQIVIVRPVYTLCGAWHGPQPTFPRTVLKTNKVTLHFFPFWVRELKAVDKEPMRLSCWKWVKNRNETKSKRGGTKSFLGSPGLHCVNSQLHSPVLSTLP